MSPVPSPRFLSDSLSPSNCFAFMSLQKIVHQNVCDLNDETVFFICEPGSSPRCGRGRGVSVTHDWDPDKLCPQWGAGSHSAAARTPPPPSRRALAPSQTHFFICRLLLEFVQNFCRGRIEPSTLLSFRNVSLTVTFPLCLPNAVNWSRCGVKARNFTRIFVSFLWNRNEHFRQTFDKRPKHFLSPTFILFIFHFIFQLIYFIQCNDEI
ncbi:hypothetical protein OJAV_G00179950 [Oryzias javanicus]|uniref:Uncharacterized protein n=1 Tax=Oryzias javanicus TaxID=123683 RepID=A0A437CC68_ORYJA|nr:hypothetical protein OJAV_G00179950 [Oryzias javanicus]